MCCVLELRNEERGTPKTPKGENEHLMATIDIWGTMARGI